MKKNIIILIIITLTISLFSTVTCFEEVEPTGPFYVNGESSTITVFFSLDGTLATNQRIEVGSDVVGSNLIDWISTNNAIDLHNIYGANYSLTIHVAQNTEDEFRSSSNFTIQLQEYRNEDDVWYWYPIDSHWFGSITQYRQPLINPLSSTINSSTNNNTIDIQAGTYTGKIIVSNKQNITIKGNNKNNTVIEGYIGSPAISLINCSNISFENVTIKGGFFQEGGAVNLDNSSINLINSDIHDNGTIPQIYNGGLVNTESGKGGAVYANSSSSMYAENCCFYDNEPLFNSEIVGQTLYFDNSYATLINCNLLQDVESDVIDLYSDNSSYYLTNSIVKNPNITDATYNFCCIYDTFDVQTLTGVYNIATTNPMFTDELNHDYSLIKGSSLIGNGFDLWYCDYSVSNWNQDLLTISDLTKEIGAISYDLDRYASYTFTDDPGYNWVSFPVVDNEPQSNAIMANFFNEYSLPNSHLLGLQAQVDDGSNLQEQTFIPNYLSQTEIIDSRKGYKLRFSQDKEMNRFHGYHIAQDTYVDIPYAGQDTWVGYFLTPTQKPADAFGDYLDELYYIQHKDWTMTRQKPKRGAPWIVVMGIGGVSPSLSYGDMVNVKRFDSTNPENSHFQWCQSSQARAYSTSQTTYFHYEEEADYTPIFVEIDSTLGIREVAIYANDECKGATVVENDLVMIHGYLSEVPDGTELELRTWDNSRKNEKVDFNLFNQISNIFEPTNCLVKSNIDYYRVTLGANNNSQDDNVDMINSLTINNYPNPFNPETTISFNNPESGKVSLSVYNIKGQLVKTLIDEETPAGTHSLVWNGKDERGKNVASGIYFTKIKTVNSIQTKKMLLMK